MLAGEKQRVIPYGRTGLVKDSLSPVSTRYCTAPGSIIQRLYSILTHDRAWGKDLCLELIVCVLGLRKIRPSPMLALIAFRSHRYIEIACLSIVIVSLSAKVKILLSRFKASNSYMACTGRKVTDSVVRNYPYKHSFPA